MPSWIPRRIVTQVARTVVALISAALMVFGLLLPVAAAATPSRSLSLSRSLSHSLSASGVLGDVSVQNLPQPTCSSTTFRRYHLAVPGATVTVYNLSCFSSAPRSNLNTLIYRADEGTVSRSPETTHNRGLMATGDLVVVTAYTIYWISVNSSLGVARGRPYTGSGLIAGEWPIAPGGPGSPQPVFAFTAGPGHWAPNWLLPGSAGNGIQTMVNGLGVRVVPSCGTDASPAPGVGTFVIQGTADRASFKTPPSPSNNPNEHLFQFSGLLAQEDTNGNTVMSDCMGHRTYVAFTLTYRFYDALDPHQAYGITSESRLNQVEVAITPLSSDIQISVFGMGDDLQTEGGGLPMPQTMSDTGDGLQRYVTAGDRCGYGNEVFPAGAAVSLCDLSPATGQQASLIQESDSLQAQNYPAIHGLAIGNIAAFTSAGGPYALSYLHPPGFSTAMPPLRDSLVWNTALGGVSSVETQWVGVTDPPALLHRGQPVDVGVDQDIGQSLNPPTPKLLSASPAILPARGGTVSLKTSTLAGFVISSHPALNITASASSSSIHTVTIPPNTTGEPINYTFALTPRISVFTPDTPRPVTVRQAASPVAAFTA
ncbi:MAG: hypothetical protein J2O47_04085, partial [Acidimicrobiaceae bacterium]|nr:hypothetical protein [Acidimicrobiaceae bacterium]